MTKKFKITPEALNTIEDVMRAGTDRYAIDEIAGDGFFLSVPLKTIQKILSQISSP